MKRHETTKQHDQKKAQMSDLGTRRTPYSIPDGTEPYPEDRMSWACEQFQHMSAADNAFLIFLSRHAWGRDRESDRYPLGVVRTEWASIRRIAEVTGQHKTTVQRAMLRLRAAGYVSVFREAGDWRGNRAPREIKVWWYERDDRMREAVRAGSALPEVFEQVWDVE